MRYPSESIARFDQQFAEDDDERRERWHATKMRRTAEGRCWQCEKPVDVHPCAHCGAGQYRAGSSGGQG
jgi:hypothetical protein